MKGVIYARYSSERQTEQSIDGQLRECKAFAKQNNITIVGTYIDRAISGKTDHRPDFQRMIKDSDKHQFDVVIVYKLDRFSRNRYDSAIYRAKLKKNNVKVLSAKENITDSPEGIILESLLEGMAEYYSAELSQKIKRGMKENALKCKSTGGNIALGYKIAPDKTFIIDPASAPIVKEIFEMFAAGNSITKIINTMNEKGYRTSRNVPFNKNSLKKILRNRKYIGIYEHAGVVVEGGVPAIIDEELFERVQIEMNKNQKAPAKNKSVEYALSTKIFCGDCGGSMIGESGRSKNNSIYYYYKCSNRKRKKNCDLKNVKRDWIEDLVINATIDMVLQDDVIEAISENIVKLLEYERENNEVLLALQVNMKDVEKQIKNVMNAIKQGIITESTKTTLMELESMKSDLELRIAQEELVKPTLTKAEIIFWLDQFKNGDLNDVEYQKRLIDVFVNSVFVYDDKIVITYNYSDNNNKIKIQTIKGALGSVECSDLHTMVEVRVLNPNTFITENVFGIIIDRAA